MQPRSIGALRVYSSVLPVVTLFLTQTRPIYKYYVHMKESLWNLCRLLTCTSVTHCVCNLGHRGFICTQLKRVIDKWRYCWCLCLSKMIIKLYNKQSLQVCWALSYFTSAFSDRLLFMTTNWNATTDALCTALQWKHMKWLKIFKIISES